MRLPKSCGPSSFTLNLCIHQIFRSLLYALSAVSLCPFGMTQNVPLPDTSRQASYNYDQWAMIASHLPDPATATPQLLEQQGDILRARRFPEEALKFYNYALDRGGNRAKIMNKLGLTQLEMRNTALAKAYFQRVVKLDKKDADGWNNLGAVEFLGGEGASAVAAYKKAVKLKRREAIFHSNLGTAYFEQKDYKAARTEMALAMKLDPQVFEHDANGAGVAAHVLSSADRARMSYEMAKLYAQRGELDKMWHSLAMASEAGMDVLHEMKRDTALSAYLTDPQFLVLMHNADALKSNRGSSANAGALPTLGETKPVAN